jgi:hypothetical protein
MSGFGTPTRRAVPTHEMFRSCVVGLLCTSNSCTLATCRSFQLKTARSVAFRISCETFCLFSFTEKTSGLYAEINCPYGTVGMYLFSMVIHGETVVVLVLGKNKFPCVFRDILYVPEVKKLN